MQELTYDKCTKTTVMVNTFLLKVVLLLDVHPLSGWILYPTPEAPLTFW